MLLYESAAEYFSRHGFRQGVSELDVDRALVGRKILPAVRAKLVEFRRNLADFAKASGGAEK